MGQTLRILPDVQPGQTWRLHFGAIDQRGNQASLVPEPWGSGHRVLVILAAGRRWITAVNPSTLHIAKLHVNDWHRFRPRKIDQSTARALRQLRQRRALFNRCGSMACTRCNWDGGMMAKPAGGTAMPCPACGAAARWRCTPYPIKTLRDYIRRLEGDGS